MIVAGLELTRMTRTPSSRSTARLVADDELAGLADDRAGADDEDGVDVVALGHYLLSLLSRTRSANRSKR